MKREVIVCWVDILIIQMNQWVFFTILVALWGLTGEEKPPTLLWMLLGVIPVLLFFIRRYTNSLWILVGSHLLCAGVGVAATGLPKELLAALAGGAGAVTGKVTGILIAAYGIGCIVYSIARRIQNKNRLDAMIPPIPAIAIMGVILMLLHSQGEKRWDSYYVIAIIVYLCCYFLQYYMEDYLYFLEVNEGSTGHIPEKEIFKSGFRLTVIYVAVGAVVLFSAVDIRWVGWLLGGVKRVVIWLIGLMPAVNEQQEVMQKENLGQHISQELKMQDISGEPWWIWELLQNVMMVIMICVMVFLLIYAVIRLVRFLRQRLGVKVVIASERIEEKGQDIREKCSIERAKRERKVWGLFLSPAEKIRHIYRQYIISQSERLAGDGDRRILQTFTVRECEEKLQEQLCATVYEKARYSGQKCTKEDVEKIKKAIKR